MNKHLEKFSGEFCAKEYAEIYKELTKEKVVDRKGKLNGEERLIQWTKIVLAIIYGTLILWRVW